MKTVECIRRLGNELADLHHVLSEEAERQSLKAQIGHVSMDVSFSAVAK